MSSPPEEITEEDLKEVFVCEDCGAEFPKKKSLEAHALRAHRKKSSKSFSKQDPAPEKDLVQDFKAEGKLAGSAVAAARSKLRLKKLDPQEYARLYGDGTSGKRSLPQQFSEFEFGRYIRSLRLQEEGGGSSGSPAMQRMQDKLDAQDRKIEAMKEKAQQKEMNDLKAVQQKQAEEIKVLKQNQNVVQGEFVGLIHEVKEGFRDWKDSGGGPLTQLAAASAGFQRVLIEPLENAPKSSPREPRQSSLLEQARKHGLVTTIREKVVSKVKEKADD